MIRTGIRLLGLIALTAAAGYVAKSARDTIDVSPIRSDTASPNGDVPSAAIVRPVAPLQSLGQTRDRPLFSPTRRPPAADVPPPEPEAAGGLTLIGLMRPAGKEARALIRVDGSETAVWVNLGAEVGGYVLRDVRPGTAILERGGRTRELQIRPTRTAAD